MSDTTIETMANKGKAVIAGLGRSGVSAARFLAARGWQLAVTDSRADPPGRSELAVFASGSECRFGALDTSLLDGAQIVVASPGLSPTEPMLRSAASQGIAVIGDIELFARHAEAPVVGITGTNGKSTVTTLLGGMARRAGCAVAVGGNLGTPALDLITDPEAALYVLELSSFQLDTTHSLRLRAGAVLNVTADHLDRYGDLTTYAASKARLFERCDTLVVNLDDALVSAMPRAGQTVFGFSIAGHPEARFSLLQHDGVEHLSIDGEPVLSVSEMRLTGLHNAANALAALALAVAIGLPRAAMLAELREFPGLPHRSQWVGEHGGVRYIDDSKGTNVGATLAAVGGMRGPLVLIAGGEGKGQDFTPLAAALAHKVKRLILIGRDGAQIAAALQGVCQCEFADSMESAVRAAAAAAERGDTVLLSPACASLDMFRDYAHRGELFAKAVGGLGR
jgi:UDP-N-acetylmuramoylalanine--D-glutamate ligase